MRQCESCSANTYGDKRFCGICDKRVVFYCSHCGDSVGKPEITEGKCHKCYSTNRVSWVEDGK